MAKTKKGKSVSTVAYKHDGSVHRTWKKGTLLDASDDQIIALNINTLVIESTGRRWHTREPAVCVFYPNKWYNVICMIRKKGIFFYCNLASPAVLDNGAVKYIDYELDVKVWPDGTKKILDKDEYFAARLQMDYPDNIDKILWKELDDLCAKIDAKVDPFNKEFVMGWYKKYQDKDDK